MSFFQKYKKVSEKLYSSIEDLPIWNWNQVHDTGNLGYLLHDHSEEEREDLGSTWDSLYDQYIKAFGISKQYLKELQIRKKIAQLQCELIITGDLSLKSFIGAEESYLEDMRKGKKLTFYGSIKNIEKDRGFRFDPKIESVKTYYTYID